MNVTTPVSIHGGHSGQFCNHATDTLEEVILTYIDQGYAWVGITEHMPPVSDAYVYPEEKEAGLNAEALQQRFDSYIATCRRLQDRYADDIRIFVGFETEDYTGSLDFSKTLITRYSPDYVVGSLHHVNDIPFDYSQRSYQKAADHCGGLDELYATYFDRQHEMIRRLRPRVVGHMDIIRIYDADYRSRLIKPVIWEKIVRNLELVKQMDLILDFNLRPLAKGHAEPYLSAPILHKARDLGIDIVPGDDSHGVASIGDTIYSGIRILQEAGVDGTWRQPID